MQPIKRLVPRTAVAVALGAATLKHGTCQGALVSGGSAVSARRRPRIARECSRQPPQEGSRLRMPGTRPQVQSGQPHPEQRTSPSRRSCRIVIAPAAASCFRMGFSAVALLSDAHAKVGLGERAAHPVGDAGRFGRQLLVLFLVDQDGQFGGDLVGRLKRAQGVGRGPVHDHQHGVKRPMFRPRKTPTSSMSGNPIVLNGFVRCRPGLRRRMRASTPCNPVARERTGVAPARR